MCASKRCEGLPVCRVKAVPSFLIHFKTLSIGLFPARTGLPRQEKKERKERETSAGLRSDAFPIWRFLNNQKPGDTAYRTGLRDNNCGLRNFQRAVSTGHSHSTENETGFENQSVSDTNVGGGYMKVHVETRQRSTSSPGRFSLALERPEDEVTAEVSFFPIIFLLSWENSAGREIGPVPVIESAISGSAVKRWAGPTAVYTHAS